MERKRKIHRNGELDALYFDKLPQRAKEIFFEFLSYIDIPEQKRANITKHCSFNYDECESPIEVIFNFAFDIVAFVNEETISGLYLLPQFKIETNNTKYRVDFLFSTNECESPCSHFEKELNLVIECDGHEFHEKTKEQVKKNNQRDMDLKMAGYDVLHFSGSQIYDNPFQCAKKVVQYIIKKTK